jgi:hypothetical protein
MNSKVAKTWNFGRLAKSPCFLEGAQRARNSGWLRIFEGVL